MVDPQKLLAYNLTLPEVEAAIRAANGETSSSVVDMGEASYIVRTSGYIRSLKDLEDASLGILAAFLITWLLGIPANIMSLGGIAIAIGVMMDAPMVMIENMHKHLEKESGVDPWAARRASCSHRSPSPRHFRWPPPFFR